MAATRAPLPILQGERCLLRALVAADVPALVTHADDPAVARNLFDGFPQPYTREAATAWATRESHSGEFGWVWGIEAEGCVVGCIGLLPETGWMRCNAEIGYWIGQSHWRRGLASDAVRQVTDWAFAAVPELTRLVEETLAANLNIKAAMARVEQARAAARGSESGFFPAVNLNPAASRSRARSA